MKTSPPSEADLRGELFDFQVNGFAGVDFQRDDITADGLRHAVQALHACGAGCFFPTFITDDIDRLCRKLARFEALCDADAECRRAIVGYHLEGPWLSPEDGFRGAHPKAPIHAPRLSEFEILQEAARGHIRLVTLAPEWPGSPEFIAAITSRRVNVSLGHTNASGEQIDKAIAAGARFCTHLGNATPALMPRHDNVVQRLLARDELIACFIPDGMHLPPFTLRNFFRAKPRGKALFTTDAMAGAGAPPGRYTLGTMEIEVGPDRVARQPGGGGFAGSTLTPADGVRLAAEFLGIPTAEAKRCWSQASLAAFGVDLPVRSREAMSS